MSRSVRVSTSGASSYWLLLDAKAQCLNCLDSLTTAIDCLLVEGFNSQLNGTLGGGSICLSRSHNVVSNINGGILTCSHDRFAMALDTGRVIASSNWRKTHYWCRVRAAKETLKSAARVMPSTDVLSVSLCDHFADNTPTSVVPGTNYH